VLGAWVLAPGQLEHVCSCIPSQLCFFGGAGPGPREDGGRHVAGSTMGKIRAIPGESGLSAEFALCAEFALLTERTLVFYNVRNFFADQVLAHGWDWTGAGN
ncbi:MAG TPA: hypothetical protein VLE70_14475, partial [Anaerolineae bacterium]|nr:hypothetical protein [Anaerolineae bacterium]